jgi:uncharacterized membrane protein
MTDEHASVPVISRGRLEMLVDGVFAIAMTILVLELKVPELVDSRSGAELVRALASQAPTFLSYLLSFAVLGVFWYRHNHLYRHYRVITRDMLVFHFVQLAAAAFFPFCAAMFGRYPMNPLSLVCYLGCIAAWLWASLASLVSAKRSGSLAAEMTEVDYLRSRKRLTRGSLVVSTMFVFYLVLVLVTLVHQ